MKRWLLTMELIDSPLLMWAGVLSLVLTVALLLAKRRRPRATVVGAAIGAAAGVGAVVVVDAFALLDGPLPGAAAPWVIVTLGLFAAGIVGVASAPWWGRLSGLGLVVVMVVAGALGVNAAYGVTHTAAAVLGIQMLPGASLPAVGADQDPPGPLYESWSPPDAMPERGQVSALTGSDAIPAHGYAPRDAAIYLPPAALVADPPSLPMIVFMMGQPGTPDPTALAAALDTFASAHGGLAPIAIVADQLGSPERDPACADSGTYGAVATYFNESIPAYVRSRLNVIDDPSAWVIGGYSNGGACALAWGAQHPDVWGHILDVSGNEFPGSEHIDQTIADAFGGNKAAFEAAKPVSAMAAHPGAYARHTAVFTSGSLDTTFGPGQVANAAAAQAAGFTVVTAVLPGADHGGAALTDGIAFGIDALAPTLGLAAAP